MKFYDWRLDEWFSLPGCAPLWDWVPVLEQAELFPGMEYAGGDYREGREAVMAGSRLQSNLAECEVPSQFALGGSDGEEIEVC